MQFKKGTDVRDFPLKTTGGATAAKTQKIMCTCLEGMENLIRTLRETSAKEWEQVGSM